MAYADLVERLTDEPEERTVTALPDGSVDVYYAVCDAEGERIEDRETLADRFTDGEPSFPVERESTEPGGQAVNMARQANALGDRVRLYGHLDDPVFDDLGFERVSMGEPSRIGMQKPALKSRSLASLVRGQQRGTTETAHRAGSCRCIRFKRPGLVGERLGSSAPTRHADPRLDGC